MPQRDPALTVALNVMMRLGLLAIASLALCGPWSAEAASSPLHQSAQESSPHRAQDAPGIRDRTRQPPPPVGPGRKGATPAASPAPTTSPAAAPIPNAAEEAPIVPGGPTMRTDARARSQQRAWRTAHGETVYRYSDDPQHRLVFATCLDDASHREMQAMLAAQADQQIATLFGAAPEVEVFVAIATPGDTRSIFAGSPDTAGMYEHPLRRLVSSDIGTVLRHEFTHLMHFGHMERLGQPHPIWVQEGLAALYESYDLTADGSIVFQPNPRHNQARAMASARTSVPLAKVLTMTPDEFMARSQTLYPQMRSFFEYIADSGKLRRWYRRYTETFATDRTGRAALEDVFAKPLAQIDADWRIWVLKRPALDTVTPRGDRAVGIEVSPATDGVQVTRVQRRSAAQRAGIQVGDVVLSVAGTAVRSPREWLAATAALREPAVAIVVRRKSERLELTLRFDDQAAAPALQNDTLDRFPHRINMARLLCGSSPTGPNAKQG